jgi:hypothetical protein
VKPEGGRLWVRLSTVAADWFPVAMESRAVFCACLRTVLGSPALAIAAAAWQKCVSGFLTGKGISLRSVQGPGRHRSCVLDKGTSGRGLLQPSWILGLLDWFIILLEDRARAGALVKRGAGLGKMRRWVWGRNEMGNVDKQMCFDGCLRRAVVGVRWRIAVERRGAKPPSVQ